jgi:pimeloyl-ACP methyl ester carboxylesterase
LNRHVERGQLGGPEQPDPDRIAMSQELAGHLPRARSLVVEGTAHLPSLERPGRVAEATRTFLAEALDRS